MKGWILFALLPFPGKNQNLHYWKDDRNQDNRNGRQGVSNLEVLGNKQADGTGCNDNPGPLCQLPASIFVNREPRFRLSKRGGYSHPVKPVDRNFPAGEGKTHKKHQYASSQRNPGNRDHVAI